MDLKIQPIWDWSSEDHTRPPGLPTFLACELNTKLSQFQEKKQKEALTRKQQKGKKNKEEFVEDQKPQELLQKPKEYVVKFTFPAPPPLAPPVLGLHCMLLRHSNHYK